MLPANMTRIVIAGGGPAGFMAGIAAAESSGAGAEVEVRDAARALETLLCTGGGRCNLTNAVESPRELAASYPRGGKFLLSVFSRFGARETMEWFRSRGLELAVEAEGRVFPASRRAQDVRDFLEEQARSLGVKVREKAPVVSVRRREAGFLLETRAGEVPADAFVIATGGDWRDAASAGRAAPFALPGSGYRLAQSLGHEITPLAPALSGLVTMEKWPRTLAGLTVSDARIVASFEGLKVADERGDLLFTHRGISGPLAFRVSSRAAFIRFSTEAPMLLSLSLFPEDEEIEDRLSACLSSRPRQSVAAALRGLMQRPLAEAVTALAGVDGRTQCAQVTREDRKSLARLLAGIPLSAVSRQSDGEIVTAGGIALDAVDPKTMGSKIVKGLFFCGEVLDIDGFTGGFNLQAAWSTGRLAGLGAAAHIAAL
jgi:predicted Rossmann fold flavoprotein